MTDFNLSDKIRDYSWPTDTDFIFKSDVKEFIRLLKEEFNVDFKKETFLTDTDVLLQSNSGGIDDCVAEVFHYCRHRVGRWS